MLQPSKMQWTIRNNTQTMQPDHNFLTMAIPLAVMVTIMMLKGVLNGITTVQGFFNDCEGDPSTLVMLSAGVSLTTEPEHVLPVSNWWVLGPQLIHSVCWMLFFLLVCQLYWHWSPYIVWVYSTVIFIWQTFLWVMLELAGVMIIDFGHSRLCDNNKAKDNLHAQLHYLLG